MKMKKTKILGLVLALIMFFTNLPFGSGIVHAGAGDIQINDTNFPDKKFRQYVSNKFDIDKNNMLSQAEIGEAKEIEVNRGQFDEISETIKDLKGIEFFTELETLNCYNNRLEKIDLRQNKKLKTLNCGMNNLTSLDVTQNKALSTLRCDDNKITEINLSENKELANLNCVFTQITRLDLKNNEKLTTLECSATKIANLDLSKNKNLSTLYCKNTQLSELDLSGLKNLKNLDIYMTKIKNLDLKDCEELTSLTCSLTSIESLNLSGCKKLTEIDCSFTRLKELDVSSCSSLKKLLCNNSSISNLILGGNKTLTTINCSNSKLTEINISDCIALEELDCRENQLTQIITKDNKSLTKLICYKNKLTKLDLINCPLLKELECYLNQITSLNIDNCKELLNLNCSSNKLQEINLNNNTKLQEIDCSSNELTNLHLNKNQNLKGIRCEDNKINSLDLSTNKVLKSLYCYNNQITKLNLKNNKDLEDLNLSNNKLTLLDLSNNENISNYYYDGKNQTTSFTLEADTDTIKTNQLGDTFDLSKVDKLEGGSIDEANNSIKLNEGATFIKYRYKARNKCYLYVTVNLNFKDKIVVIPNPANPGEVADGRVRITFDAVYGGKFDGEQRYNYIDVLKGTNWDNEELINALPKTVKSTSNGLMFDKWEPDIPKSGNVSTQTFAAKYKYREFNINNLVDIEVFRQPSKREYTEGEPLDISDLGIKLIDSDGAYESISYFEFNKYGINADPENKHVLQLSDNNKKIKISKGKIETETFALTVNPKQIIGPVNPSKKVNPDKEKYWTVKFISADETKGTVAEKNTFYVSKVANKTLDDIAKDAPNATPIGNNKFNGWDKVLNNSTQIDQDLVIKAQFSELETIIGPVNPSEIENPDKSKYYKVTFKSQEEQNGTVAEKNTFYVLKNAGKTLADIADKVPETTPKKNYIFDKWDQLINEGTEIDQDLTINAIFVRLADIIGPVDSDAQNIEELKDPSKYYKVTFMSADANSTLYALNAFYVLKTSGITLSNVIEREENPDPIGDKIFVKWESTIKEEDIIESNLIVKAIFKEKGEIQEPTDQKIIGPVDPNAPGATIPSPNEYWTVTFVSEDTNKGTIDGANTFYIPMNESKKLSELNIDLIKVTANPGFKFEKWDPALDGTIISENKVITAIFTAEGTVNPPVEPSIPSDNIIGPVDSESNLYKELDKHKDEYYKLIFDDNDYTRIYVLFVKKGQGIRLTDIAAYAPNVVADEGYVFTGWSPMLYGNTELIENDRYIVAEFEEIGRPYRPYWPDYREERPYRPYRPYRHYEDDRDTEPVVEEKPVEVNEYDKLEAILFINDTMMQKSVNGVVSQVRMDIAPFIYQARTMLPIRYVAESLGFMVTWDANTRTVYLVDKENIVQIPVDTNNIIVNGKAFVSDVKPMIKNNRTMLPVANVARALGLQDGKDILWDAAMKFVTLRRNVLK